MKAEAVTVRDEMKRLIDTMPEKDLFALHPLFHILTEKEDAFALGAYLTDEEIRMMDEAACGLSSLLADTA